MNQFCKDYLEILNTTYSGLNLTRLTDYDEFYSKQYLDSIVPFNESSPFHDALMNSSVIVDVGFGGGIPILPLASLPELRQKFFLGVESIEKKVKAVDYIAQSLKLKNVSVIKERIENISIDMPNVVLISKAVAAIDKFVGLLNYSEKITVFFYKGPKKDEELELFKKKYDQFLDWKIVQDSQYRLPSGETRFMLGLELKVPHRTKPKRFNYKISKLVSGV
jgi:16S rRNA (guanine527-N7)-methyltransferase